MDISTPSIVISKDDIFIHKSLKKSYFDIYLNSNVGDNNMKISYEELFVLMLPLININDLIDKCSLDKDKISKLLTNLLIDLNSDTLDINETQILVDNPIYMKLLKHKIKSTSEYNFNNIFDELVKICNSNCFTQIKKYKKLISFKDQTNINLLIWACKNNKSQEEILLLLTNFKELYKPEQVNDKGSTALYWACKNKMNYVAIKLIDEYKELCKPEQVNDKGNTALLWACYHKMNDVAIKLIDEFKQLCKPEQVDNLGSTSLYWACRNKINDVAIKLIDEFKELCKPEQVNDKGNTALYWACTNKMYDVSIKLIHEFK